MSEPRPLVTIACLCAAWCRTCEGYQPVFEAVVAEARARVGDERVEWVVQDLRALEAEAKLRALPGVSSVQVVMTAPKNGFYYVIDRKNGKLIS